MGALSDTTRRMALFGAIGAANTVIDMAIYAVLTEWLGVAPLAANVVSFSVGALNSYFLNGRLTFNDQRAAMSDHRQALRFAVTTLACLAISSAALWLGLLVLPSLAAKLVSVLATFVFGYALNRMWVFKSP